MSTDSASLRSLMLDNLPDWADETYIYQLFSPTKSVARVRMMRGRRPGGLKCAHIEFLSREAAEGCLGAYNGTLAPNCDLRLDLSWATENVPKLEEHSAFVGDLSPEINDASLLATFQARYRSAFDAKVVTDPGSARSKGFGFVRFSDEAERDRAIQEMHGFVLGDRPLRLSMAQAKRPGGGGFAGGPPREHRSHEVSSGDFDPTNTTLFIGGLPPSVTEADLGAAFAPFGATLYVRVPPNKGCGFVQFAERAAAVAAMQNLTGQPIHGGTMRISWGRNAARKPPAPASRDGGYYGGGGGYAAVQSVPASASRDGGYYDSGGYPAAQATPAAAYAGGYDAGAAGWDAQSPYSMHGPAAGWGEGYKGTSGSVYSAGETGVYGDWRGGGGGEEGACLSGFGREDPGGWDVGVGNQRFVAALRRGRPPDALRPVAVSGYRLGAALQDVYS